MRLFKRVYNVILVVCENTGSTVTRTKMSYTVFNYKDVKNINNSKINNIRHIYKGRCPRKGEKRFYYYVEDCTLIPK